MKRHTAAIRIKSGCFQEYRKGLGDIWTDLTKELDRIGVFNFSIWSVEDLVFCYCETSDETVLTQEDWEVFEGLEKKLGDTYTWISVPRQPMRLMYHDFGVVRGSKELIRHRVFITQLKPGMHEEYKRRHDGLVSQRGGNINPGPDSNFSIWNAGDYIFGYDEIDITMEKHKTEEEKQNEIKWETSMLEIMDWITDDVDWLTGIRHPHIQRIGYHN